MTPSPDYSPPSPATMKARQDETEALRLLIAQRRLYSRAKRWLAIRWLGMVVIGVGAPLIAVLWPSASVVAGAVAGVWLFAGRTVLVLLQSATASKAAAVQEQFDILVFGMPDTARRPDLPTLEELAAIAGPDHELRKVAESEDLIGWYTIDQNDDAVTAVAIAQRANASYSNSLLKTTAKVWWIAVALWVVVLGVIAVANDISFERVLLGFIFPVLPAFLDVVQHGVSVRRSASEKAKLASHIEDHLTGKREPVKAEDLLVWQAQLFDLRRSAPEVPDVVYKVTRKKNERAMKSAARQLSDKAKRRGS